MKAEPVKEPFPTTATHTQTTFEWLNAGSLVAAIFLPCVIWAALVASVGWNNTLSDAHGFRQTHTAITSYYFAQGGSFINYETPIIGAPWSVPFEFPLYQWIVAKTARIVQAPLDQTGRVISEIFFALSLLALWALLSELQIAPGYRF